MKPPEPLFLGTVSPAGKLTLDARDTFVDHVRAHAGQRVELVLRKHRRQRSNQQNKYYWSVVVEMVAEHCGYEPEEAHEALAWHLLAIPPEDGKLPRRQRTPKLDTAEFGDYVERVKRFAAEEWGLYIPDAQRVEL